MFGPLSFQPTKETDFSLQDDSTKTTVCMLCEEKYILSREKIDFLKHLFGVHCVVIRDVKNIACLEKYVEYWKIRLKDNNLKDIGAQAVAYKDLLRIVDSFLLSNVYNNCERNHERSEEASVYVLSDKLLEDKTLRNNLHTERLVHNLPRSITRNVPRNQHNRPVYKNSKDNHYDIDQQSVCTEEIDERKASFPILLMDLTNTRHSTQIVEEPLSLEMSRTVSDKCSDTVISEKDDSTTADVISLILSKFVIEQQKREREMTTYCRECLFCHTEITGSTTDYLDHLSGKHNLLLGRPQNLVFVDQLINTIEEKLVKLLCLYCEKIFKDRNALKEHMRKKQHKSINPKNTEYDRFYLVNYLEVGKNWKTIQHSNEKESPDSEGSDAEWTDWGENMQVQIVCLFCKNFSVTWEDTLNHLKSEHNFDYKSCTTNMDFYQQVKLVNYIRRQIHRLSCIKCDFKSSGDNIDDLLHHMCVEQHFSLPDKDLWDQPEYFFPTYENDTFLCHIDDETCDLATVAEPSTKEFAATVNPI